MIVRTLTLALLFAIAAPLPLLARTDPGAKCAAARVSAAGKACSAELSCHAKYAGAPGKDPRQLKLEACLAKNEAKLAKTMDKIQASADKRGTVCSLGAREARLQGGALATATRLGLLTDWDSGAGDVVDDRLRASLLKAGGKACGQTMAGAAKEITKPTDDGVETRLARALIGFARTAGKAIAKAEKSGGSGIDTDLLQAVVDNLRATAVRLVPRPPGDPEVQVVEVSSGDDHSCLLRSDGRVRCWGDNSSGQTSVPKKKLFSAISAGGSHSCGIRDSDEHAQCWGDDSFGQVSDAPDEELWPFAISAGGTHTCARRFDNTVVCWGDNRLGQLDPPSPLTQYASVSAGRSHTCGVRMADQKAECWGDDSWNQSSAPDTTLSQSAREAASAGGNLSCGVASGSSLVCWGNSQIPPAGIYFDVSSGENHACALSSDDFTAACWGEFGPWRAPPDNETFVQISSGGRHTCALRDTDLTVTCWGNDERGQTSCAGVAGCTGAAPPPCRIANEGPVFGKVGRITVTRVLGDPNNDFRLILPRSHLEVLRDAAPGNATLTALVAAFDDRGFSCDGDDRIAIEFPGEELEVISLLHYLGLLEPVVAFIADEIVVPIKQWLTKLLLEPLYQFAAECIVQLVLFQSSCV